MVKIKLELVGLRQHADKMPADAFRRHEETRRPGPGHCLDPKMLFYDEPSAGLWTRSPAPKSIS